MSQPLASPAPAPRPKASGDEPTPVTLPYDTTNEAALIAAAYVDAETRANLLARLVPDHFQQREHRELWQVFQEAMRRKLVIDLSLVEQLGSPELKAYVAELIELRPDPPQNVGYHVENLLWDHARLSAARGPIQGLIAALRDPKADPRRVRALARAVFESVDGYGEAAASPFEFVDAADVIAGLGTQPPPVWQHFAIVPGRPTLLAGYGGVGKTLLAQVIGLSVAAGLAELWGTPLEGRGPVRHLDYECGPHLLGARTARLAAGLGIDAARLGGEYKIASLPRTYIDDHAETVLRGVAAGAKLVIIDSLAAAVMVKAGENDSERRKQLDAMTRVSIETGCAFLVLVHEGKQGADGKGRPAIQRVRGASAITDAAGAVLSVTTGSDGTLTISQSKASAGQPGVPLRLRLSDVGEVVPAFRRPARLVVEAVAARPAPEEDNDVDVALDAMAVVAAKESIVAVLRDRGRLGKTQLVREARGRNVTKRQALKELLDQGTVVQEKAGRGAKLMTLAEGR